MFCFIHCCYQSGTHLRRNVSTITLARSFLRLIVPYFNPIAPLAYDFFSSPDGKDNSIVTRRHFDLTTTGIRAIRPINGRTMATRNREMFSIERLTKDST
jgi:hypothetical protein